MNLRMHNKVLKISTLWLFLLFLSFGLFAANPAAEPQLRVTAKLYVKGGNSSDAKMVLYVNGNKIKELTPSRKNFFELDIDYNKEYILSFEKPDYVTKKIQINTKVPSTFNTKIARVTDFDVELFKQQEGQPIMSYKNPVGRIHYDAYIDDFNYDTDYTRQFQEQLREEERLLALNQQQAVKAKQAAEEEARQQQIAAQAAARRQAEAEKKKAEEEARKKEAARIAAEAQARKDAEAKAKEEQRLQQEEASKKAAEQARRDAAEQARKLAEQQQVEAARLQAEAEKVRQADAEKKKALEEARRQEAARIAAEAQLQREAEAARKRAEEKHYRKEQARIAAEAQARKDAEAMAKADQLRQLQELAKREEERKQRELAEKARREAERELTEAEKRKREDELRLRMIAERLSKSIGDEDAAEVIKVLTPEDIARRYKRERVDEITSLPRITITRTVFNRNNTINFYTKVEHIWGSKFYFKDGFSISEFQYKKETANN